jgi:hypothetical protein
MPTPRRDFLKSAFVSIAAAGLISQSARFAFGQKDRLKDAHGNFQIPSQALGDPLFHFTRTTYKTVNLRLVKIEDQRPQARQQKGASRTEGECFLLLFQSSGKLSDLQQTYVLQHEALGKFSLFLVDAGQKENATYYSAVINHTRPGGDSSTKM